MRKGFSLVELMIVVAIIGILAAIAIPNFVEMQLKSKRSEAPGAVDGIKTSELAYDAAFDSYLDASASPSGNPGKTPTDWAAGDTNWDSLGWRPDGKVRGLYSVTGAGPTDFLVGGQTDVDGDTNTADYMATVSLNATLDANDNNVY